MKIYLKDYAKNNAVDESQCFNVVNKGVVSGINADAAANTTVIQELIDSYDDLVLYFPSGIYKLNKLDFGVEKNITFKGKSSAFATSVNKSVDNPRINDTYSRIVVNLNENEHWITQNNCTMIFDRISVINGEIDSSNVITPFKTNYMIKTETNSTKGKVFATECSFIGWKVISGDFDVLTKEEDLLHCCWLANRCRFTNNAIALAQLLDSRIVDCSFNKNEYCIIMKKNAGFSTIANSRFEWNTENAIKIGPAHDVIINANEFDRNAKSAIVIDGLTISY